MIFKTFEEEKQEMNLNMYKYILDGRQTGYPQGFWNEEGNKETFKTFLLYYLHEVLGYPKDEVPYHIISKSTITEAKLITSYNTLFGGRIEVLFSELFPEAFPFRMPFISDDVWQGTGIWEGHEPLYKSFPKWYFNEYLGLNEENVCVMVAVGDDNLLSEEDKNYRRIIRNKYRSMHEFISEAFPNKDVKTIKSALKGRITSRSRLIKKREINPNKELTENIDIHQCDQNCYFTNTGCSIYLYEEDGCKKLMIRNFDRKPTYREISYIRYKLLANLSKNFYLDIDEYSNTIILHEEKSEPKYTLDISKLIFDDVVKSPATDFDYLVSLTEEGEDQLHLSMGLNENGVFIELDELKAFRDKLLPADRKFGVFFPPTNKSAKIQPKSFHLYEIEE